MTTAATVDEFVDRILGSGLLSAQTLSHLDLSADDSPVEAARLLVRERLLTPFQARSLLAGEGRSFFVTERYKILEHLGRGGMGEVYLVEQLLLRRVAAMKVILAGDPKSGSNGAGAVERFFREARAVAALDHPNVVRVFDMDRTPVGPFLVMEYVDGANLHAVVSKSGPLEVPRAVDAARQAAAGLAQAHAKGLIHRDVKPGNLLLDRVGNVKVVDLGLARYRDANENAGLTGMYDDNRVIGTADFQAPEQGLDSGSADARSDVYGLGAALFYLLAGRVPFPEGTIANKLLAHQMKPVPDVSELNPEVPPELAAVVGRMMAKRPADRPQTMSQVRAVLEPWAADELPPPTAAEMPKHPPAAYRLGLCPPPASAPSNRSGPPTGYAARSGGMAETPQSYRTAPASMRMPKPAPVSMRMPKHQPVSVRMPRPAPEVIPTPAAEAASDDFAPVSLSEPEAASVLARPLSRRTLLLGMGGGLMASAVAGGVYWYLTSPPGGSTKRTTPLSPPPPPTPPVTPTGLTITGSGSTFVAPAMEVWGREYAEKSGVGIKYTGGGSGKGVTNTLERDLPFGCSDDPVSDKEFEKYKVNPADLLHIPLALGAVVPMYNVPGVGEPLLFTGPLLAQIYLGEITNWTDERLSLCSPKKPLPDLPIRVVVREDSSGTTAVFTDYLCKVYPQFLSKVGQGKKLTWPAAAEAKGNAGVAERVNRTAGAIGYVELTYVLKEGGRYGYVQNRKGKPIKPTPESVTAAASGALAAIPDDLRFSLTNPDGDDSYPISGCAWALLFKRQPRVPGQEVVKFLRWATSEGQKYLPALKYAALPDALVRRIEGKLNSVEYTG